MRKSTLLGCLIMFTMATVASAQAPRVEITPFVGYQFGGELAEIGDETTNYKLDQGTTWGLMVDVGVTGLDQVEIYYSSQNTNLKGGTGSSPSVTVDHFQIGAIHNYAPNRPVNPYIGLTLGGSRFEVAGGSDTRFSGAVTGGVKMVVSDHLGFRFDGRIFGISTGTDPITCSDELCIGYPNTSIIWQYTVNAGVIIHFGG